MTNMVKRRFEIRTETQEVGTSLASTSIELKGVFPQHNKLNPSTKICLKKWLFDNGHIGKTKTVPKCILDSVLKYKDCYIPSSVDPRAIFLQDWTIPRTGFSISTSTNLPKCSHAGTSSMVFYKLPPPDPSVIYDAPIYPSLYKPENYTRNLGKVVYFFTCLIPYNSASPSPFSSSSPRESDPEPTLHKLAYIRRLRVEKKEKMFTFVGNFKTGRDGDFIHDVVSCDDIIDMAGLVEMEGSNYVVRRNGPGQLGLFIHDYEEPQPKRERRLDSYSGLERSSGLLIRPTDRPAITRPTT